jgi:hypothetical protein
MYMVHVFAQTVVTKSNTLTTQTSTPCYPHSVITLQVSVYQNYTVHDNYIHIFIIPNSILIKFIYRVIQEESAILWEMTVCVILSKKVHMNVGPNLKSF